MIKIVVIVILIAALLLLGLSFYWGKLFKRIVSLTKIKTDGKAFKIIHVILSIVAAVATVNIFSGVGIILLHIVAFSLITELINLIIKAVMSDKKNIHWEKIYKSLVIPIIASAAVFAYGFYNIRQVIETDYTVKTSKNISQNYRILLIADVHFGTNIDEERLEKVCNEMNETNPDVVILCGDIVDENTKRAGVDTAFDTLAKIKSTYGTYFVYGNHDRSRYNGNKNFSANDVVNALNRNGIKILSDETAEINGEITLAGREDRSIERMSSDEILRNTDKDNFIILLDHQPEEYKENSENGADLQLSGHTHAGQIFPAGYFIKWFRMADLYYGITTENDMTGIVTSGLVGWGYPIRTQEHSEYVVIDIEKE